jgi:hypothetical protein
MNQLQIKATLLDIESKTDKNGHPYYRLSLQGMPGRYFYAFSTDYHLKNTPTLSTLTNAPHNLINRQVLITYEELPNKDNSKPTFFKVKEIEIL